MKARLPLAVLAALTVVAPLCAGEGDPRLIPARIEADTTLSGRWMMAGDVEVPEGVTLRVSAGTTIDVGTLDGERTGAFARLVELHVRGRILCEGTRESPIVIGTPPAARAESSIWQGITLHARRERAPDSTIRGVKFIRAIEAVLVTDGAPRIEDCVFHSCAAGVLAACILDERSAPSERGLRPQPEIASSLFANCEIGVFAELDAAPSVSRCSFLGCRIGVGNSRPRALSWPVTGMGARADRCLFLRNRLAFEGGGIVENSIFLRNDIALELSQFHSVFASRTDRFAWRRNVLWDNVMNCSGEADVGEDNLVIDPCLASEPEVPSFGEAAAPLAGVGLTEHSPARGVALGGGDPGPVGAGPTVARGRVWKSAARALRTVLVLGPPERVDLKNLPKAAPAAAGERVGGAWWAAFPVGGGGEFRRSVLRLPSAVTSIAVSFPWQSVAATAPSVIEVNADGNIAVWSAGAPLRFPSAALRYGSVGVTAPLATDGSGAVIWWNCADLDPRIGVALDRDASSPADASPAPALEAGPVRFGPRQAGLRLSRAFHWADLGREGVFRLRTSDGTVLDADDLGLALFDPNGTLRIDLPAGIDKTGAKFVIDGLRDPAGRVFAGQPFECAAWLPE